MSSNGSGWAGIASAGNCSRRRDDDAGYSFSCASFNILSTALLLGLVRLHPGQDVVERPDRIEDMRALVQHDAFGAVAHRRIRDLGQGTLLLNRERSPNADAAV
jgi:hypothetical protein